MPGPNHEIVRSRPAEQSQARRALLKALELLALMYGLQWVALHASCWRAVRLVAERDALRIELRSAQQTIVLLQRRLDRVPPRQRPHCDPESRFRILALKHLLHGSIEHIARTFRIAPQTLTRLRSQNPWPSPIASLQSWSPRTIFCRELPRLVT